MRIIQGLILRSNDYGEKDRLLTIALSDGQIVSVKAVGVRSATAKLRAHTGVLTLAEFGLSEGKAGYILNSAEPIEGFYACWTDEKRNGAAMLCIEMYYKCFYEGGETEDYLNLLRALREINFSPSNPYASALIFIYKTSVSLGIEMENIIQYDPKTYDFIKTLAFIGFEEICSADFTEEQIIGALGAFIAVFKCDYNVDLQNVLTGVLAFAKKW